MATRTNPLCAKAIKNSSKEGDIVLDGFGGSGSTLIAAEQLNRICYTMELDAKYIDVIVKRYIEFKGNSENIYLLRENEKISYSEVFK